MAGVPASVVERSRALVEDGVPGTDGPADASGDGTTDGVSADGTSAVRAADDTGDDAPETPVDADATPAQKTLTGGYAGNPENGATRADGRAAKSATAADAEALAEIAAELRALDVAGTTPLEALNALNELKRKLDD